MTDQMTDADYIAEIANGHYGDSPESSEHRERLRRIAARLRTLSEQQGEPIAWFVRYETGHTTLSSTFPSREAAQSHADKCVVCATEVVALYSAPPQPAAGDAARALPGKWREEANEIKRNGQSCNFNSIIARADELEAALSAAPVAGVAVAVPTPDQIERHAIKAGECPPQSSVVLVSSIKRLQEIFVIEKDSVPVPSDAVRALYDSAAKGFHVTETSGLDEKYLHVSKFKTMEDLHAYRAAWLQVMRGERDAALSAALSPRADSAGGA